MDQESPTAKTDSQVEHLNSQTIAELQDLLGANKFKYLVEVFCENSNKSIEILLENDANYDFDALNAAAHSMAGSSANMGAIVLSELCRQLEQQAKVKIQEHISMIVQGIVVEQKQVLAELSILVK